MFKHGVHIHISLLNLPLKEKVCGYKKGVVELCLTKIPSPTIPVEELSIFQHIISTLYFNIRFWHRFFIDTFQPDSGSFNSSLDSDDPEGLTFVLGNLDFAISPPFLTTEFLGHSTHEVNCSEKIETKSPNYF